MLQWDWTLFELNFGKHPWKSNLIVQIEFPKLEEFLIELQRILERSYEVNGDSIRNHEETI